MSSALPTANLFKPYVGRSVVLLRGTRRDKAFHRVSFSWAPRMLSSERAAAFLIELEPRHSVGLEVRVAAGIEPSAY